MKKIYIIAGEHSGDFIGSQLIKSLKNNISAPILEYHGIGGTLMEKEGIKSLFAFNQINLVGFFEIIPHIFKLKKLINQTVNDIVEKKPDILVTIDSPGFTYRVAAMVKKVAPDIKLVHIVAPSVWAYKPKRAVKYARLYDQLLTLFPFEPEYFTIHGLKASCIGHPIIEQEFYTDPQELRRTMGITGAEKIIAVTPGSRQGEIKRHMPIIRESLDALAITHNIKAIFVQSDDSNMQYIGKHLEGAKFAFTFSTERLKAFAVSDCALAKSGTNSFEIAASSTPMIVGYKLNFITYLFVKMMIKVKYACLLNIIANKEIVPEYIQSKFTAKNITAALTYLLKSGKKDSMQLIELKKILKSIGFAASSAHKPSEVAAQVIIDMIK